MLFFGFSAGLPILLIFSSLSLWLREAGVERSAVTFFSWAALGYSFKFVWAPLVDRLPIFFLSKHLGRRRGWILFSQLMIALSILLMAVIDPARSENSLYIMAIAAVMLGFSSATQDIVIDAYRIESAGKRLQAMMASTYIAGYRIGMLCAGAGALFVADFLGSGMGHYRYNAWKYSYFLMASFMLIGIITTLLIKEPEIKKSNTNFKSMDYIGSFFLFLIAVSVFILSFHYIGKAIAGYEKDLRDHDLLNFFIEALRLVLAVGTGVFTAWLFRFTKLVNKKMIDDTYIEPVKDFFLRYGFGLALILLSLIGLYRISDIVLGVISNLFYQDLGFTKTEIARVVKTFGLFMTIAGGFLGGILSSRFDVIKILFAGALLSCATNLLFLILSIVGNNITMLYVVISADNLSAGLASSAFVAFLSSLTNIKFTAVQYAVFSSLMTLLPKLFGGYSGTIVDSFGYDSFFIITTIIGLPVLFLILIAGRYLDIENRG